MGSSTVQMISSRPLRLPSNMLVHIGIDPVAPLRAAPWIQSRGRDTKQHQHDDDAHDRSADQQQLFPIPLTGARREYRHQ